MALGMLNAVWRYRGFILGNVKREFQAKYRSSMLGGAWAVINPLAMIVVYTVIFAQVMRSRLAGVDNDFAYSIFLCSGVLTWGLFVEITTRAQNVFIENANLIKKISFPRVCLPMIVVANAWVNFSISFGLFLVFLVVSGNLPGLCLVACVPILLIQMTLAIGLGISLGVLNVFFRDVGQFFGVVMQFWFWFTPVVYPASALPAWLHPYLQWNPMTPVVTSYQGILVYRQWPHWGELAWPALLAVLSCLCAAQLYRKHVGEMVDEL